MLPLNLFSLALENLPLFAIDLLVINQHKEILLGKRVNAPAKGFWFVPGGRVFKNEQISDAFARIARAELGSELPYMKAKLIGLYDHFYSDSAVSDNISTHYINAAHVIRTDLLFTELPRLQHADYRWVAIDKLESDPDVHFYSKVFLKELKDYLKHGNNS